MASEQLDAIVFPTAPHSAALLTENPTSAGAGSSAVTIANLSGLPDLTVPAGSNADGMPVNVSFLGPMFAEPRLLALGYSFEQLTHARRLPVHTPALKAETVDTP
jgi:amidase